MRPHRVRCGTATPSGATRSATARTPPACRQLAWSGPDVVTGPDGPGDPTAASRPDLVVSRVYSVTCTVEPAMAAAPDRVSTIATGWPARWTTGETWSRRTVGVGAASTRTDAAPGTPSTTAAKAVTAVAASSARAARTTRTRAHHAMAREARRCLQSHPVAVPSPRWPRREFPL